MRSRAEDALGRALYADTIARQIASTPSQEGVVFGLVGAWGSGKTSLLNMVVEALESGLDRTVVLRLNPWHFSGTEHLVGVFFEEIGAQLLERPDERLKKVGKALERYGGILGILRVVPGAAPWAAAAEKGAGVLGRFLAGREEEPRSLLARRRAVEQALDGLEKTVVVMIDDLDRLRLNEIRDVVSLVRLNADLPNVVFVLAYDRRRVEEALEGIEGDGRAYLEKIVQVVYDLPEVREADLSRVLVDAINGVLGRTTITGPFDQDRLHGVLALVIRPLFKTVRDVRRYTNSLFPTLEVVGDEVALDDVLAIEAVRVLLPDVYAEIVSSVEALTTPAGLAGSFSRSSDRDQEARLQVHRVIDAGEEHSETVRELIGRIFPAGVRHLENKHYGHDWVKTWSKDRRLAHQRVLRFYLEKRLPEGRRGFLAPMAEDRLHAVVRRLLEKVEDGEARQRVVRLAEPMIRSPRPRLSALTTSWLGSNLGYLGSCWRRLSARTASSVALGSSVVVIIDKIWMRGQWARSRRRSGTWADNVLTSKC